MRVLGNSGIHASPPIRFCGRFLDRCVGAKRTPTVFQITAQGCEATLGKRCTPLQIPTLKGLHMIWNPFRVRVGKGGAGCPRVASRPWAVIGNRVAVHGGIPLMRLRVGLNRSNHVDLVNPVQCFPASRHMSQQSRTSVLRRQVYRDRFGGLLLQPDHEIASFQVALDAQAAGLAPRRARPVHRHARNRISPVLDHKRRV